MLNSDNKLLINTENTDDLNMLYNMVKKNDVIRLEEIYGLDANQITEKNAKKYLNEIVIPLSMKSIQYESNPTDLYKIENCKDISICNNYLYIKLYISKSQVNFVLTEFIYPFTVNLIAEGLIEEMFFIRYYDSNHHLRIRFKGDNNTLLTIIPKLNALFNELNQINLSNELTLNVYSPEINRYGGENYFKYVERYFYYDSIFSMELLYNMRKKKLKYSLESITVASLVEMFKNMGLSYELCCKIVNINNKNNKNIINYREYRDLIINILKNNQTDPNINIINIIINKKESKSELSKLKTIKDVDYLCSIINSIIHMTCNRIDVSDNFFELKIRELLRCIIRDSKYWGLL